jgi:hypothetical protein
MSIHYYAHITSTEPQDTMRYKAAQRLFRELVVANRRQRLLEIEAKEVEYMTQVPEITFPKVKWPEAVRHAFSNCIGIMTI